MNRRLQQFLSAENISQSQLAEILGVARASVSHILSGRNKPGFDFILNMTNRFPALNIEWLISGKGRMYTTPTTTLYDPHSAVEEIPSQINFVEEIQDFSEPVQEISRPKVNTLDNKAQQPINQRSISKILVFYTDGTFQELV
ncbi:MAG: helix-turn-helix transcriptional regulator [Bacteroidales bacterium]|nr:helix-turn-helix transcriptional regulator [Bacteroidales bacterium]